MTDHAPELLPDKEAHDIIVAYFDSCGLNNAKAGASNILAMLKDAGLVFTRPTPAERPVPMTDAQIEDEVVRLGSAIMDRQAERPAPQVREALEEIAAICPARQSSGMACKCELCQIGNIARAALTARPSDAAVACEIRTTGDSIESLSLLADAVWSAREDFCDSMGSKHEATYRRALENVLWNDKGGIALALRELVDRRLALPPDEPAREARLSVDRERKALKDRNIEHPQTDGFINDYD